MIFLQLLLSFAVFLPLSLVIFYLPGFWIVQKSKEKLEDQEILALSFCLSLIIFLIEAVFFGLINLRVLTLPTVTLIGVLIVFKFKGSILTPWRIFLKFKFLSLLMLLGILTMGFINFPNGIQSEKGLMFWSSQGYDGTWHIALMEEIKKSFPPKSPIFSGENLSNYHYFADVIMGEFNRVFFFFSPWDLYFRFFPALFSFMIIISVYSLLTRWQNSQIAGYLGIFFTVFVGSFGYIVNFLRNGNVFGGETVFWAAQLNTIIGNPPHAISLSLMSVFFLALFLYQKSKRKYWLVICFLLAGFIGGFKVSAGVTILVGVTLAAFFDMVFNHRFSVMILAIILGISNAATFRFISREGASLLVLQPWWFIHSMIQSSDRLNLIDWEHKRQHYLSKGTWHAWLRIIYIEALSFLIFLVGNLGMRIIGFYALLKNPLNKISTLRNPLESAIFGVMLSGLIIPLLFIQKGVAFNSIQFMQYFLLTFGFYASLGTYQILMRIKRRSFKATFLLLIVFLSVPTVVGNLLELYGPGRTAISKISNQELSALIYLKKHSDISAIILTMPYEYFPKLQFFSLPKPIYVWYPTPYVAAVSSRRTYLTAEEMATQTGFPVEKRLEKTKQFFSQKDAKANIKFLQENKIKYIYLVKSEVVNPLNKDNLEVFFENSEVIIYKVI